MYTRLLLVLFLLPALTAAIQPGQQGHRGSTRKTRGVHKQGGRCRPCRALLHLNPAAAGSNATAAARYIITELPPGTGFTEAQLQDHSYLLRITYYDTYEKEGWDRLQVVVNSRVPIPDAVKAHAAGYSEAFFTSQQMSDYWANYKANEWKASGGQPSAGLLHFIEKQAAHTRELIHARAQYSKYWRLMGLLMDQFDGIVEGYQSTAGPEHLALSWQELYMLQSVGDLYELNVLFPPSNTTAGREARQQLERRYTPGHGIVGPEGYGDLLDCSALIKLDTESLPPQLRNMHTTSPLMQPQQAQADADLPTYGDQWGCEEETAGRQGMSSRSSQRLPSLGALLAWLRRVVHGMRQVLASMVWPHGSSIGRHGGPQGEGDPGVQGHGRRRRDGVRFWAGHNTWRPYYAMRRMWKVYVFPWIETGPLVVSSSPGLLFSKDDWYTTDQFVVMETTNGIYNKSLYDDIHHKCSLMWQRAMVANFGATSGREWVQLFSKHNSGTYNNQWMVLDVEALDQGWAHDVLWVLEQIPGRIELADATQLLLDQGYWASYNVPFFPVIYNLTGYPADADLWRNAPRARIFARDAPHVDSLTALKKLLRYNRYQKDELSEGKPNNAIAARYDLPALPGHHTNWTQRAYGAVDAKVVSHRSFRSRTTHVICGPTTDHQPVFSWSTAGFTGVAHEGTADVFDFAWQRYRVEQL